MRRSKLMSKRSKRDRVVEVEVSAGRDLEVLIELHGKRRQRVIAANEPVQRSGVVFKADDNAAERFIKLPMPFHPARGRAVDGRDALETAFGDDLDRRVKMIVEQLARTAELEAGVMHLEPARPPLEAGLPSESTRPVALTSRLRQCSAPQASGGDVDRERALLAEDGFTQAPPLERVRQRGGVARGLRASSRRYAAARRGRRATGSHRA